MTAPLNPSDLRRLAEEALADDQAICQRCSVHGAVGMYVCADCGGRGRVPRSREPQLARAALALAELWPALVKLDAVLADEDSGPRECGQACERVLAAFRRIRGAKP